MDLAELLDVMGTLGICTAAFLPLAFVAWVLRRTVRRHAHRTVRSRKVRRSGAP